MKKWNFKVKSNVQEIIKKLDSSLNVEGFVFNIDNDKKDSVTFKVRKRGLYAFTMMFTNKIIVNGNILKTNIENETNIEISFTQYFLMKLIMFFYLVLGLGYLIAITSGIRSSTFMYMPLLILLVVGIAIWIAVKKKFKKDIQEYKALISDILSL
jgi:hypothetical protein